MASTPIGPIRRLIILVAMIPLYFTLMLIGAEYDGLIEWYKQQYLPKNGVRI